MDNLDIDLEESEDERKSPERSRELILECEKVNNQSHLLIKDILKLWKKQMNISKEGPYEEPTVLGIEIPFEDFIKRTKHSNGDLWDATWDLVMGTCESFYVTTAIKMALAGEDHGRINTVRLECSLFSLSCV